MTNKEKMNTDFLRFLAIIFIINSHMDNLYPIPLFATGGAIGNSLFFMLSSYGLLLSERKKPQSFWEYYSKRISRIYPPVWINIILLLLPLGVFSYLIFNTTIIFEWYFNDPLKIIEMIYYPPHWFLDALMFFYLIGFLFIKNFSYKKLVLGISVLSIAYIIHYLNFNDFSKLVIEQTMSFKLIFYLIVFLVGLYFADKKDSIIYTGIKDYVILFLIIFLIYLHKFLWYKGVLVEFQFIQQLLLIPMLFYFLKISKSPLVYKLMSVSKINKVITIVAAMTLELYIIHGEIRFIFVKYFNNYPYNIFIYLLCVFFLSYFFYKIDKKLSNKVKGIIQCK